MSWWAGNIWRLTRMLAVSRRVIDRVWPRGSLGTNMAIVWGWVVCHWFRIPLISHAKHQKRKNHFRQSIAVAITAWLLQKSQKKTSRYERETRLRKKLPSSAIPDFVSCTKHSWITRSCEEKGFIWFEFFFLKLISCTDCVVHPQNKIQQSSVIRLIDLQITITMIIN